MAIVHWAHFVPRTSLEIQSGWHSEYAVTVPPDTDSVTVAPDALVSGVLGVRGGSLGEG